jgi:hypothetical protein
MKEALQSGPLCALAGPTRKVHHLTLMFYVAVECILGAISFDFVVIVYLVVCIW